MHALSLSLLLALVGCGDPRCPSGAHWVEARDAGWCEDHGSIREGPYTETIDGVAVVEANYRHGLLDGPYTARWPDARLREIGAYHEGAPDGWWQRWAEDGTPLPDRLRVVANPSATVTHDNPNPAVAAALTLGSRVGTPKRYGDLLALPLETGLAAIDPTGPSVAWIVDVPHTVRAGAFGGGVRTASLWTTSGDLLVTRVTREPPEAEVIRLGAVPSPEPHANDFGAVYVDGDGTLHDTPLDATTRPAPSVPGASALHLAGDRLFVGTGSGALVHWERLKATERWRAELGGGPVRAIAAATWHQVFAVVGNDVVALSFSDGTPVWRTPLPELGMGVRLEVAGDLVVVRNPLRHHVLAADSGQPVDVPWADGPGRLVALASDHAVRFDRDRAYILRPDGPWLAVHADLGGRPLVERDTGWLGTHRGHLLALRPTNVVPTLEDGPPVVISTPGDPHIAERMRAVAWVDSAAGARRVALRLPAVADDLRVEVTFLDLPRAAAGRGRSWAAGWTFREEDGLVWTSADGRTIATGRPGDLRAAWRVTHEEATPIDPSALSDVGAPAVTRIVHAVWEGRPGPWLAVFDEGPAGYTGFAPRPVIPDAPVGETL